LLGGWVFASVAQDEVLHESSPTSGGPFGAAEVPRGKADGRSVRVDDRLRFERVQVRYSFVAEPVRVKIFEAGWLGFC
jgi:hypothetical protein